MATEVYVVLGRLRQPHIGLTLRFVLCDAVALLNSPDEFILLPADLRRVVVSQLGPLLARRSLSIVSTFLRFDPSSLN